MKKNINKNLVDFLAKESVNTLKCDIGGTCSYSGELIINRLLKEGITDFYIITGYVSVPGWTGRTSHSWILYDNKIVDPVFEQFPKGTIRLESFQQKYKPMQYLNKVNKNIINKNTEYINEITDSIRKFFGFVHEAEPKPPKNDKKPPMGKPEKDVPEPMGGAGDTSPEMGDKGPKGGLGGDIFGGDEPPMGSGGPDIGGDGSGPESGGDEKSKISNYNEKLKSAKIVKFQKIEPEPGYKFEPNDKFYTENYVGKTKNGSVLLAVPKIDKIVGEQEYEKNLNFIKTLVIPKINEAVKNALKQKKRVVLIGNSGVPSVKGEYTDDEQGIIAKYLNEKYKGGYVIFDTWAPQEYFAFISNDELWQQVKERTESENLEIKSALYLYLLTTLHGRKFAGKLKTENVLKTIESWGVSKDDAEKFTTEGLNKISQVVYPEISGDAETIASFIIKTYLQLLRVNMMKKVLKYEKEGKVVIVVSDENTAWALKPSFDKADEIATSKEEPPEQPEGEPSDGGEEPAAPEEKPTKEKQPPEEK